MLLLVIWLPIAALVWQYSNFQRADLPPDGELLPYVAAENLDPTLTGGSGWYTVESNPLLKSGYEIWEWSEDWQIHTICDCPRLELLAELLYSERLEALLEESGGTAQQVARSGLDRAITAETEQGEALLLRAGTAVLLVETEGVAGLTDHLDDYVAVLADFQ